ncbi:MAG: lysophospholipase [Lachnospiraceae bacterium]|nr:lysophospholipase [Lachnospiraceae bacterium]
MSKQIMRIGSCNGTDSLYTVFWKPAGSPKAVLQIVHGMIEHIERYAELANVLNERGILVVGNDHIGHGRSVKDAKEFGYFKAASGKDPAATVLQDIHLVTDTVKKMYPDIPYFLLGHSMGSFFARSYIDAYGDELDGAMIMGTGDYMSLPLMAGRCLIKTMSVFKGDHSHWAFLDDAFAKSNNRRIKDPKTPSDWLSHDEVRVEMYRNDPLTDYTFTLNGYDTLIGILLNMNKREGEQIRVVSERKKKGMSTVVDMPVAFLSGSEDPIGDFGKGPKAVARRYRKMGYRHVSIKLYKEDRHEILHEIDRGQVAKDVARVLEKWIARV